MSERTLSDLLFDRRRLLLLLAGAGLSGCAAPASRLPAWPEGVPVPAGSLPDRVSADRLVDAGRAGTSPSGGADADGPGMRVPIDPRIAAGQILIDQQRFRLYHVESAGVARLYPIAVGRAGLIFHGEAVVGHKAEWPAWRPTGEMIARNPEYARFADGLPGGPGNPLGARALYLYRDGKDTFVRIHGTNQPGSIGQAVSSGCIRMRNEDIVELFRKIPLGTSVRAIEGDPEPAGPE